MKITSFFPEIFVKDIDAEADALVKDFGLEIKHKQVNGDAKYYIIGNEDGNREALVSFPDDEAKLGLYAMRINVDDMNAAINYFLAKGYKNPGSVKRGGLADIHGNARYELMVGPDGNRVDLVEHQK